jgi:DnaJ-class molecular chaperone
MTARGGTAHRKQEGLSLMGMDVFGESATSPVGDHFRNNVWSWFPLAKYSISVAPAITSKCKNWLSNDGDGLNAADSKKLADILQVEIDSGRAAEFAKRYQAENDVLPDEPCDLCEGTGQRQPPPQRGAGDQLCNGCNGKGSVRPWATHDWFSVENVQSFVAFLRECGGFRIH